MSSIYIFNGVSYEPLSIKKFSPEYLKDKNYNRPLLKFYDNKMLESECYYKNGLIHRIDGPAVINYRERSQKYLWFYKEENYTKEVKKWLKENNMDYKNMKEEDFNRMWMEIL